MRKGKEKKTHGVSGAFAAEAVEFSVGSSVELEVAGRSLEVETSVTATERAAAGDEEEEGVEGRVVVVTEDGTPEVGVKPVSNRRE